MEDYAKMVKKEKAEHPEFTDKQIDQIVADHLKSKDNCSQFSPDRKTRANAWRDKTNKYNGKCPEFGGKTTNHGRRDWCPNCEKAFEAWETK